MVEHPPLWHGMAAGACSAVIARAVTYPPDTVKARLQVQGAAGSAYRYTGTLNAFSKIAQAEGIAGFYRGYLSIIATVIPANACYFTAYEFGKRMTPPGLGMAGDMVTATIAQTVAGVVFCPIDILKQRVQTQGVVSSGQPLSVPQAAKLLFATQGLPGFYRGFLAMNALWLPWNCIYLSLYEESKRRIYYRRLEQMRGSRNRSMSDGGIESDPAIHEILPLWAFPMCSSACAVVASVATHPIDVAKTRLQVLSASGLETEKAKLSVSQVARSLFQQEGLRGFTRGMSARVATVGFGSTVSWATYETVKRELALLQ